MTQGRNMRSRYRCSMCPAIHINSRSWLRSSSTHEPSDPPLRVIFSLSFSLIVLTDKLFEEHVTQKTRQGRSPGRRPGQSSLDGPPHGGGTIPGRAGETGDSLNLASHGRRPPGPSPPCSPRQNERLRSFAGRRRRARYPDQKRFNLSPGRPCGILRPPHHRTADSGRPSRADERFLSSPPAAATDALRGLKRRVRDKTFA